ncbi:MAG: glycoside hydrolase family 2 TIM barrel-domain containing protein [Verrucomicrobiota bacterium]
MKSINTLISIIVLTTFCPRPGHAAAGPRQRLSMDLNWMFTKGDPAGAQNPAWDDTGWRPLDLPHDWSIEGPYDRTNSTAGSGGYMPAGIGWYRKHFPTPAAFKDKHVSAQFDGVFMNADVYLNGHPAGHHAYGYTSFTCDLTPFLAAPGGNNVLAVRVANDIQPNSRWYTGSGIYRHVWADVTGPVHVANWGAYVTTPNANAVSADVIVRTRVQNDTDALVGVGVYQEINDAAGKTVGHVESLAIVDVPAKGEKEVEQTITVSQPQLWTLDSPALYTVRTSLFPKKIDATEVLDSYETPIGIRQIDYDADRGFFLNGQHVKLVGECLHHDGGAVGAAVPVEVWERRLKLLKAMGCNAIRCSHNPPAPEFLDLCDRLGLMVMDEAFDEWTEPKGQLRGSYATLFNECSKPDLLSMLQRDRNHPSITMWSIGNEIPDQSEPRGVETARILVGICHAEDPTRPVTSACDQAHSLNPTQPGFLAALDIAGYNYVDRWGKYRELFFSDDHEKFPRYKLLGTEDVGVGGVRGNYFDGSREAFSYATSLVRAEQLWKFNSVHDYVIGYFMWTGVDYLGESTWPRRVTDSGILDTCGFPKDGYYLYQSLCASNPMVHLMPHWNYPGEKGAIIPVVVFSNCRQVELQLNGKSYGAKSLVFPRQGSTRNWNDPSPVGTTADLHLTWDVPYEPGILRAIGRRDGQIVAQEEIRTAGPPAALALKLDNAVLSSAARGVAQVEVRVLDASGIVVPTAGNVVALDLHGPAKIIGNDNGDPSSHDSYQAGTRPVFNGMALVTLQAGKTAGHVTLSAKAEGLKGASVELDVQPGTPVPTLP